MNKISPATLNELIDFLKDFRCSVFIGDDSILQSLMDKANKVSKKVDIELYGK